ncbi:hypothetical protein ACOI1C_15960 [Bacillus sp. DJP31]|uniref:hypothetical protein n=1 Tax=Bacillus sp. DJP31 TaxID=3409789 RepID=UPI003BB77CB6
MRNRVILCLLICAVLLNYAVPRLTIHFSGIEGIFGFAWFMLAILVIGGNLSGFLYSTKKQKIRFENQQLRSQKVRRYLTQH